MATSSSSSILSRKRNRLTHDDYKIACFVPLSEELAPLQAMLDSVHDVLPINPDRNAYILGEIGVHNVVLVQLCAIGTHETSAAAVQLQHDFPAVKFGLLVGVAGGIPNGSGKEDIRLGDIVVSVPDGRFGGVVQFDRGKRHNVDDFQVVSCLNKPAPFLNATVKKVKAQQESGHTRIPEFISDMLKKYPAMLKYDYPGFHNDTLYHPDYEHTGGSTCQGCDTTRRCQREPRPDNHPKVHYGTIGSSNGVLRSASERDRLGREYGMLCVEMEAAGLMDTLPCLVIRGICDYADSHKNKMWQPYAATVAAAYVKELLNAVPPIDLSSSDRRTFPPITTPSISNLSESADERLKILLDSLHFQGLEQRLRDVTQALPRTCEWLFEHQSYQDWILGENVSTNHGFLWIKGKPGSGKSTILKATLRRLENDKERQGQAIISYFFHARATNEMEKSTLGLYRTLTYRMLHLLPHTQKHFLQHFESKERNGVVSQWAIGELQEYLTIFVRKWNDQPLTMFIDALDEGDDGEVSEMIAFFEDLASHAFSYGMHLRICLSSRHYPHITIKRGVSLTVEDEPGHEQDITTYIKEKLVSDSDAAETELEAVRSRIHEKSRGIFLWVFLVVGILNTVYKKGNSIEEMNESLEKIPEELDGLFSNILARDNADLEECVTLLQWVLFARRSLNTDELCLAVRLSRTSGTINNTLVDSGRRDRYLLDRSRGLVEIINANPPTIQFIHETVREFLEHKGLAQLRPALRDNVQGLSNDTMKTTCQTYINTVFPNLEAEGRDRVVTKTKQASITKRYPLLVYAVCYMFYHADVAEANGVFQKDFLHLYNSSNSQELQKWAHLHNLFQPFKVRWYSPNIHLLYVIADRGHEHLLEVLLGGSINVNQQGERFGSALQAACAAGFVRVVDRLVRAGADVNLEGGEFGHPLCTSIQYKREAVMKLLSQEPIRSHLEVLWARLFTSIARNYVRGVEILLDVGVLDFRGFLGLFDKNPLDHAIVKNKPEIMELLIRRCGHMIPSDSKSAALLMACEKSYDSIIYMLLNQGVDVNFVGGYYGTALQAAAARGNERAVQMLITMGADVNNKSGQYGTALQAASYFGHSDIIRILLAKGADVNIKAGHFGTPLQAATAREFETIMRVLLHHGADVNIGGGYYAGTALVEASGAGNLRLVQLLLERGADVNMRGGYYGTAIQVAAFRAHENIVQLLLNHGADVNEKGGKYVTALHAASEGGHDRIVQMLLDNGADVNVKGGYYGTALQVALIHGRDKITEMLREHASNLQRRSSNNRNR